MHAQKTTLSALAWLEHDMLQQASQLKDLAEVLAECGAVVPICYQHSRQARRLRSRLLRMLRSLDGPLHDAIQRMQGEEDAV